MDKIDLTFLVSASLMLTFLVLLQQELLKQMRFVWEKTQENQRNQENQNMGGKQGTLFPSAPAWDA